MQVHWFIFFNNYFKFAYLEIYISSIWFQCSVIWIINHYVPSSWSVMKYPWIHLHNGICALCIHFDAVSSYLMCVLLFYPFSLLYVFFNHDLKIILYFLLKIQWHSSAVGKYHLIICLNKKPYADTRNILRYY